MAGPAEVVREREENPQHSFFSTEEEPARRFDPLEIDLSTPAKKDGEQPREPDPGAQELQRQLEAQRAETARAEAAAREAQARANMAERRVVGASVSMIDSAIEAAQRASAQAKAKFHAALDASDHRLAAEAQEEISDARHNLLRLQEQKAIVEAEAQRPQPQPQPRHPAQPVPINPDGIVQGLARTGFPRSAEWLRNHPEYTRDQGQLDAVAATHNFVVNRLKLIPETDAYFAKLEELLDLGETGSAPASTAPARRPTASAPVSTSTPSLKTGRQRETLVRLTPDQREAAELSGMTDREYAEEFILARDTGKLHGKWQ